MGYQPYQERSPRYMLDMEYLSRRFQKKIRLCGPVFARGPSKGKLDPTCILGSLCACSWSQNHQELLRTDCTSRCRPNARLNHWCIRSLATLKVIIQSTPTRLRSHRSSSLACLEPTRQTGYIELKFLGNFLCQHNIIQNIFLLPVKSARHG